jgi:hypothetical protein
MAGEQGMEYLRKGWYCSKPLTQKEKVSFLEVVHEEVFDPVSAITKKRDLSFS